VSESGVSQGPVEVWALNELRTGHVYSRGRTGPLHDGYATCRLCGAHENSKPIVEPCPENPLHVREPVEGKYYELLFAVSQKFPGETRHETALRYIREREARLSDAAKMDAGR
jgi:hypothetical protein